MERTLFVIKPDATIRRFVGIRAIEKVIDEGFKLLTFKEVDIPREFAEIHYSEHIGKPFYGWLVDFLTLNSVIVIVLEGEGVIEDVRRILGATLSHKAEDWTIRGMYGIWGGVNVAHASSSRESAEREIKLWSTNMDLKFDEKRAEDSFNDYVSKYDSDVTPLTREMREICNEYVKKEIDETTLIYKLSHKICEEIGYEYETEARKLAEAVLGNIKVALGIKQ
ncbi:MAG: nucleoside-diphosphate kinase [Candidatus Asgardarchaeia archaeon]